MNVVIGIDPHKASHTAVAIDRDEDELSSVKIRATRRQVEQLVNWAEPFEKRTWAIESAGGMGYLLAQQLVARGEVVVDVPAMLAARIRVLATERSNKNDPNDAHSIAVAALRAPRLRAVEEANHFEVLRLLAKRNIDIGNQRTRVVCRLHALLAELAPGGIAKEMYVSDADVLMAKLAPETPAQQIRYDLALELLDDVRRLDAQAERVAPAHTSGRQGFGHVADRHLRGGPDHRGADHRVLGRHPSFRQPGRLRLLQRDGTRRALFGRPSGAPGVAARLSQVESRHPHGGHQSDSPDPLRWSGLL